MHQFLHQRRRFKVRFSLIVCIALMLNLFTPALGQAMAVLTFDPLAGELCSAGTTGNGQQQIPVAGHDMKHCALCASLTGAPPPAPVNFALPEAGGAQSPALRYVAPALHQPWPDGRPRAPPQVA
jgi:hypothetical protein